MMENYKHTTVLLDEAVNGLNIRPDGIYIDGTFGRGGHSRLILSRLGAEGRLLAIDRDPQAIAVAQTIDDPAFPSYMVPFHNSLSTSASAILPVRSTAFCSISASLPRSLTMRNAAFPLCVTGRWICAWIRRAVSPRPNGCRRLKKTISPGD